MAREFSEITRDFGDSNENLGSYRYFTIGEAHSKLKEAERYQHTLAKAKLEGSRPYLIRAGENSLVPAAHVRYGLNPRARARDIAGVTELIIRIPMVPIDIAPPILVNPNLLAARMRKGENEFTEVPTYDIFGQATNRSGEVVHFLLSPEGLRAYDGADDIIPATEAPEDTGHIFAVEPSLTTADAQVAFETGWFNLGDLADMLYFYELFPQDSYGPEVVSAAS